MDDQGGSFKKLVYSNTRNVSFITFHGAHKGRRVEKVVIGKSQGRRRRRLVQEGLYSWLHQPIAI